MTETKRKVLDAVSGVLGVAIMVGLMFAALQYLGWAAVAIYTVLSAGTLVLAVVGYMQFRKEEKASKDG